MSRFAITMCLVLLFSAVVVAQEAAPVARPNADAAPLQSLEQETQLQMRALEEQRVVAPDAEAVEKQIADLKYQYEIQRLTILLEQAEAEGDEPRAAEIREALDNWLNPPAPEVTTPVQRSAPGVPEAAPEVRESTR